MCLSLWEGSGKFPPNPFRASLRSRRYQRVSYIRDLLSTSDDGDTMCRIASERSEARGGLGGGLAPHKGLEIYHVHGAIDTVCWEGGR